MEQYLIDSLKVFIQLIEEGKLDDYQLSLIEDMIYELGKDIDVMLLLGD